MERGIAVNPRRDDLRERLLAAGLPVVPIEQLHAEAISITAESDARAEPGPERPAVAVMQCRDGSVIDVIRRKDG